MDTDVLENLPKSEWRILKCKGDGNCLYRAISNQIYGNQSFYPKVKNEITEFIKIHRNWFEKDIAEDNTSLEKYI